MKSLILFVCVLFAFALTTNAQNKIDNAVNNANNSVNSANNSVTNAGGTATNAVNTLSNASAQTKSLANQLHSLLGKKKMASDEVVTTSEITVQGGNYTAIKKLNECIRNCSGVQDSQFKFNAAESTITVTHTGTTDQLFSAMEKKSPDLVKDDNIVSSEPGKLVLKL